MQASERERLMQSMNDKRAVRVGAAVKSGACLAFLALLAVNGAGAPDGDAASQQTASAAAAHAPNPVRAEAHRKAVFDERRARFDGTPHSLAIAPTRDGSFPYAAP
jgi:hypothetical protein